MKPSHSNPILFYYWSNWLYRRRIPILPRLLQTLLFLTCSAVVPYRAEIRESCMLGHGGVGVVIHPHAQIGGHVLIGQGVVIGGRSRADGYPIIRDDAYIGTGAKILGSVEIGSGCVIGAMRSSSGPYLPTALLPACRPRSSGKMWMATL
jgi:serine O-acetyltransferase